MTVVGKVHLLKSGAVRVDRRQVVTLNVGTLGITLKSVAQTISK